jgi:inward rectifier potassium channel
MFNNIKKLQFIRNSGFSSLANQQGEELINNQGRINIKRKGQYFWNAFSSYHFLIDLNVAWFSIAVLLFFIIINIVFTCLYILIGVNQLGGLTSDQAPELWVELFAFSAQTITSVGYGRINPVGMGASLIASLEALIGLASFAILTGLVYGRFSKPKIKLLFSTNILVSPFNDGKALMFRFVNAKSNQLIECEGSLMMSYIDLEKNVRRFINLELDIKKVSSIAFGWTIVHVINEQSPMFTVSDKDDLLTNKTSFIFTFKGFDQTYAQSVYTRHSFSAEKLIWNAKFITMYHRSDDNKNTILDLKKINVYDWTSAI